MTTGWVVFLGIIGVAEIVLWSMFWYWIGHAAGQKYAYKMERKWRDEERTK